MYRHHRLLADTEVFEDALGREVSTETVRGKVDCCHRHGMPALAYGAIYGAGWGFHREHPEWGLYDQSGEPVSLGGFLAIMNTSPESPWSAHIVEQYRQAVSRIGFDGIHMDTYGYPKSAYSARGADGQRQLERLEEHVPPLVHRTRAALQAEREDVALVFNCVNNWPAVALLRADTPVDAVYIEVWDPHSRYRHLVDLIRSARCRTDRPIILAAYLKPLEGVATNETGPGPDAPGGTSRLHTAEESLLLLTAVIASAGGYHLILGEADGVLTDPYYVNHAALRPTFAPYVRRYYDFLVQYARLLFDPATEDLSFTSAHGPDDDFVFTGPPCAPEPVAGSVWVVIHRLDERIALRLVNLCSVDDDIWNADKREPTPVHNLTVRALVTEPVAGVFTASPDDDADPCAPSLIRHQMVPTPKGPALRFTLPTLRRWRVVWIRLA